MFNILIPMSGRGQRFVEAGYDKPKPLIDVYGKPLIQRVVESLGIYGRYIYCVLKEHEEKYNVSKLLNKISPGMTSVVMVDSITEGAACTCLLAKKYIDNGDPLIIANSDQIVDFNRPLFIGNTLYYDGCILTFPAFDNKWSFVLTDKDNRITSVVEKEVISTQANCGIYSFREGGEFVDGAEKMIEKNIRVNNEFYIAPVYNGLIEGNFHIKAQMVERMYPCGDPQSLETTLKVLYYEKHQKFYK